MEIWLGLLALLLLVVLVLLVLLFLRISSIGKASKDNPGMTMLQAQVNDLRSEISGMQREEMARLQTLSDKLSTSLKQSSDTVNNQLNDVSTRLDKRLGEGDKNLNERLQNASQAILQVSNKLAELSESNRRIFDIGTNLQELQDILKAPKLRGVLGETFLEDMLSQVLPAENYQMQYSFGSREVVDAVIKLDKGMLPIDSKFPLENFRRMLEASDEEESKLRKLFLSDVKKQIDSIAKKYIKPEEGTFDFAFMYIPAENVYYETILRGEDGKQALSSYAISKRVIPVSPNSFYAYLQLVLMGVKGLKIEENAHKILSAIEGLKTDFARIEQDFSKLGTHLTHATNSYGQVDKRMTKFSNTIEAQQNLGDE